MNDVQILSYYDIVLQAILKAKELLQNAGSPDGQSERKSVDRSFEEGGQLLEGGPAERFHGGLAGGIL